MRAACIYPSPLVRDPNSMPGTFEPLGLQYIAGKAESMGYTTELFIPEDSENGESFAERVINFNPEIAAFSVMTFQANKSVYLARLIKRMKPDIILIAGGSHPTFEPLFFLSNSFDICVRGEGEKPFERVLQAFNESYPIEDAPGVVYRKNRRFFSNEIPIRWKSLDSLPWPVRRTSMLGGDSFQGMAYPSPNISAWASINASRGCIFNCKFCDAASFWGRCITFRSPKSVVDEMEYLYDTYAVSLFYFVDLNFTFNKKYVIKLCEEIIKSRKPVYWFCMSNLNTANDLEMISAMKEANCTLISFGVDSVNNNTLKRAGKRPLNDKTFEVLDMVSNLGIVVNLFYMIGFPWETEESILHDVERLYLLNAHKLRVTIATPFPGTEFYKHVQNQLLPDYMDLSDTNHLIYKHNHISPESMRHLQAEIFQSFYTQKVYKDRVRCFLSRFPRYKSTFESYWRTLPFAVCRTEFPNMRHSK